MNKEPKTDSLKNQSENFNENFTQEKEQIIIDGVNIIGTIDEWARLVAHEWGTDEYSDAEIVKNYILDINKQLARKTRELEVICKAFDIEYAYDDDGKIYGRSNKLRSLEQECEALKSERFTRESLITEQENEIDELRQECEELNKLVEQAKDAPICFQCEQEARIRQEKEKFKKALEEIEEVIKSPCAEDCVYYEYSKCYDCIKTSILYIINKAKGGNE